MSNNRNVPHAGDGADAFTMDSSPMVILPTATGRYTVTFEGEVELDGVPLIITPYSKTAEFDTRAKAAGWLLEMDRLRAETVFINTEGQVTAKQFRESTERWIGAVKRFYEEFGKEMVPCDLRMTLNQLEVGVLKKRPRSITKFGPDTGANYHGATPPVWR